MKETVAIYRNKEGVESSCRVVLIDEMLNIYTGGNDGELIIWNLKKVSLTRMGSELQIQHGIEMITCSGELIEQIKKSTANENNKRETKNSRGGLSVILLFAFLTIGFFLFAWLIAIPWI